MRIQDIVRLARRNIVILLAALIVGSAIGLVHATLRTPKYESESLAVVSIGSATSVQDLSQGSTFTAEAVATYAQIATTPYVLSRVIHDLGLHETAAALAQTVTVSAPSQTSVLSIVAVDPDPTRAANVANAVTKELAYAVTNLTPSRNTVSEVTITQLQPALPPTTPTGPGPLLETLLGLAAGLLVGIGLAAIRVALDTRVRSQRDLEALTSHAVLGSLAFSSSFRRTPLLMAGAPFGPVAESFRSLRANLQFLNFDGGAQAIVVTSSLAAEGKSTSAANLAITIADAGRSVVLVDADLRRPKVADYFGLVNAVGLTDVLLGETDVMGALEPWGENGLRILPAGRIPPNPSELLQSDAMAAVIGRLREDFEVVLIDSPPVLAAADAAVLGHVADGVLMIAGGNLVRRGQIEAALSSLDTFGVRLLGLVLNLAPLRGPDAYGYQAAYGYRSSGESGPAEPPRAPASRSRTSVNSEGHSAA